jgi:membrane peptidoglycan carboxypeptidase
VRNIVGHPVFGKSGTTDQDKTAVLIAGTKSLVVAGMLADPDWSQTNHRMEHPIVNPAVYNTLRDAMEGEPKQDFEKPTSKMAYGDQRGIPFVRCWSVSAAEDKLRDAGFEVETDYNNRVDSSCPPDSVAGTSPDGRTIKGGVVVIEVSNGRSAEQPPSPGDDNGDDDDDDEGNGRPGRPGRPGNPD